MRRPKTNRVERTRASGQWTEAAFFGFLRSGLRQLSLRWPPIHSVLLRVRVPYVGPNKRQKWAYKCEWCNSLFSRKEIHVDHMEECGSLRSMKDIAPFVTALFCEEDKLQVLCHKCHNWKH
jgi:hypothetical protein